jgi:hypothetical protein
MPQSIASLRWSSAGCSARTRARSATTSSTTASTSSRSASTDAARAIAGCSSIGCWRAPWPPSPTPTNLSPANPPLERGQSQIGGEKRIAHSHESVTVGRESHRDAPSLSPQPSAHIPEAAWRCRSARSYVSWWLVPGARPPGWPLSRRRIGCSGDTVRASPAGCPCPARVGPASRGRQGTRPAR